MRTTLDINEKLLRVVMHLTDARTKKEAVNISLESFIKQKRIDRLVKRLGRGTLSLTARDLNAMRSR